MNTYRRPSVFVLSLLVSSIALAQVPGAIDGTFGGNGRVRINFSNKVLTDASAGDVAVQVKTNIADANYGKMVVVGFSEDNNRPLFAMIRLNPNGTRDQGFGVNPELSGTDPNNTDGVIKEFFGSWDTMTNVAIQSDQKIVALGYISCTAAMRNSGECPSSEDWRLVRYNKNGDRDTAFGSSGVVSFKVALGGAARTRDVIVDSQGRIYAAGYANDGNKAQMFLYRLNANGTFDTTFDGDGLVQKDPTPGNVDQIWGVRIQHVPARNGKQAYDRVVVAGRADLPIVMAFYADKDGDGVQKAGQLDPTFGTSGQTLLGGSDSNSYFRGMDIDSTGRILAAGKNSSNRGFMVRYTLDGAIDTSFGTNGIVTNTSGVQNWYDDVEVEQVAQGRIVTGGWIDVAQNDRRMAAFRHLDNGTMDSSFTSNECPDPPASCSNTLYTGAAIVDASPGFTSEQGSGVTIDGSGNVLLPGSGDVRVTVGQQTLAFEHMFVARFLGNNGKLDKTFNANGQVLTSLINKPGLFATRLTGGSADKANGVVTQSDGKVIMVGQTNNGWDEDYMVVRVKTDGNLDTTFGADDPDYDDASRHLGKISFETGAIGSPDNTDIAYSVAVQSTGKIVVVGTTNNGTLMTRLFRLNTDGSLDTSFNNNSTWRIDNLSGNQPRKIIVDSSDRIYLVGGSSGTVLLARYTAGGVLEFSTAYDDPQVTSEEGRDIALQPDGKIVVAGKGRQGVNQDQMWVGRFTVTNTFTVDNTFSLGRTWNAATATIVADPNYQGAFCIPNEIRATPTAGNPTPTGTPNSDFDEAWSVVVEADGKITLGGRVAPKNFQNAGITVYPRPRYELVRLLASGWIDTSFGTNGWVSTYMDTAAEPLPPFPNPNNPPTHDSSIVQLAAQKDGRLIGLGVAGRTNDSDFSAARYLWTTGALDTTFASAASGKSRIPVGNDMDIANGATLSPDGKAIVAGYDFVREDFIAARWQGDTAPTGDHSAQTPVLSTDSSRANYAGTTDKRTNTNTPTFSIASGCISGETAILKIVNTSTGIEHPYRARNLCSSNGGFSATVPSYLASGGTLFDGQPSVGFLPDGTYEIQSYSATGFGTTTLSQKLTGVVIDTVAAVPTLTAPTNLQKLNAEQPVVFQGAGVEANSDVYVLDTTTGVTWSAQTGKIASGLPTLNCTAFSAPGTWTCSTPAQPAAGALALGLHKVKPQQEDIVANKSVLCIPGTVSDAQCAAEYQFYVKANTTTTAVSSSANSASVYGEAVTFTTTVSANVDKPDGAVIQTYDGVNVPPPAGTNVTQCNVAGCHSSTVTYSPALPLSVASHTYSATYPETNKFFGSATAVPAVTQVVSKASTSGAVTPTAPGGFVPSTTNTVYGQSVTFTMALSVTLPGHGKDAVCPNCVNPTGTVTVKVDADAAVPATFSNQQATFTTSSLSVGSHTILFTYSGDGNFQTSNVSFNHVVEQGATSTTLGSSANPSVFGTSITLTATVSPTLPAAGTRTGTVQFKNGGVSISGCDAVSVSAAGVATCPMSGLAIGAYNFTADYSGDTNFKASNGALLQNVVGPPTIAKSFGTSPIFLNGTTSLSFTLQNDAANPIGLNGVGFTDNLPAGMIVATPNGLTGTCGTGTITAVAGSSVVSLSGGKLAVGGSCTFSVDVKVTTTGTKVNTTGNVTSTEGGSGLTATASVEVVNPLTFSKAFGVPAISVGGTTTLSFTIANPNAGSATNIAFTDTMPAGIEVATPNDLSGTCGGGTITADAGTSIVSLSGATLAGNGDCTFSVAVKATTFGVKNNTTGTISSTDTGTNGTASATLTVVGPPSLTTSFTPAQIAIGTTSTATFTVTNANTTAALTGVGFTDSLPTGLVIASPSGLTGTCGSGTITADAGTTSITLSGGTIAAASNCSFTVNILGNAPGAHDNTTSVVNSVEGGSGTTANATLTVVGPPALTKSFGAGAVPLNGTTTLSFTAMNPPTNTVALSGVGFVDNLPAGMIIATPNGLSGTCGTGTITAVAGSNSVTLSGGTLSVGGSCTFTVDVAVTSTGSKVNTTSNVTSSEGGTGNTATANVEVTNPLTFSKAFGVAAIPVGGKTSLTFSIANPNPGSATNIAFTDAMPAGLEVATPNNLTGTCGGGTIAAVAGTGVISLSGATLPSNGNCSFSVDVKGTASGVMNNTTGTISSADTGTNGTASATLTVIGPPSLTTSFNPTQVTVGNTSTATFSVANANTTVGLSGISFTDTLPTGLVIATPSGLTGTCGGGTITADAGTQSISLSSATLGAASNCSFTVNIVGNAAGARTNTTGVVTSVEGGSGATASATLTVVGPPTLTKNFGSSTVPLNATTTLTFTVTNPAANTVPLSGIGFVDNLPAGMMLTTPSGLTGQCGQGVITANDGDSSVALSGGTLGVNGTCSFSVNVKLTALGAKVNTTTAVTSSEGGNGSVATASINVSDTLGFAKAFAAPTIPLNGTTTLTFTITNTNSVGATGVAFTDNLPAGLVVATPNGLTGSCGGGAISATAGGSAISLSGGSVAPNSTCTFSAKVLGTSAGVKNNVTGTISSVEGGTGETASANVTVVDPPTLTKVFGQPTVPLDGKTSLTFTVTNGNATVALTGVAFSDTMPAGLVVATPNGLTTTCVGAAITANAGSGSITVGNVSVAASASCTVGVDVQGVTTGVKNNVSGVITSTEGGTGATAKATLSVLSAPVLTTVFGLSKTTQNAVITLAFNVTNSNAADSLTGIGFSDSLPAGLVVAPTPGATTTCGGTVTATAGSSAIALSGGTVGAGTSCTVTVKVKAMTEGVKNNVTTAVTSTNAGTGNTANATLTIVAKVKGDLNLDGSTDLFWRNQTTGVNTVWYMNGTALGTSGTIGALPNPNYRMNGTDDFNGDGLLDIVWRSYSTGLNAVWLMNPDKTYTIVDLPGLSPTFQFAGTGDFNGDGNTDILIRNQTTGNNAIWLMNGTSVASVVDLPGLAPQFEFESTGDFDNDGKVDIVIRNYSNGNNALWLMNGTSVASVVDLLSLSNTAYKLEAVGDMNGDKKPDLLWRNYSTAATAIWLMNGSSVSSVVDLPNLPAAEELEGPR